MWPKINLIKTFAHILVHNFSSVLTLHKVFTLLIKNLYKLKTQFQGCAKIFNGYIHLIIIVIIVVHSIIISLHKTL